ncbi:MAG: class I SAM-dependent methyltransferase [Bacteroidales bacterium]
MTDNIRLYEDPETVNKYTSYSTRVRQLNNAEKALIDRFKIHNKKIIVAGSGGGRVPANLVLFGNEVTGIELSENLNQKANENFPKENFKNLTLLHGDVTDLSKFSNQEYDLAFFPQNGIDLISDIKNREKAILELSIKVKPGGILAFSSHNNIAFAFSYKNFHTKRNIKGAFSPYYYAKENVLGGGILFKGQPKYIINRTEELTGFKFIGFTCDIRNRFDGLVSRSLFLSSIIFGYILYVFENRQ